MGKETENELRAQKLLKKLKRKPIKEMERPFFVEITGSPSSGKTTMARILDPFFRRQGFTIYKPLEGAEEIRIIERDTHLYNATTATYALYKLMRCSTDSRLDLVIFDRCLVDGHTWMDSWVEKGDLSPHEAKKLQNYFYFPTWFNMLDAVFIVITTPEEAMRRDRKESLTQKFGDTTNPESIKKLIRFFEKSYEKLSKKRSNIFLVDTTKLSEVEMTEIVLDKTLTALEKRFLNK